MEAFGSGEHDSARARLGAGECAAGAAVFEAEDRAGFAGSRGVPAAVSVVREATLSAAMVDISRDSPAVWLEILGLHFGRRGARHRNGGVLGTVGVRGDPGIRADGDDVADQRESSVSLGQGVDREGAAGTRGETGGRRRDHGAGWRRGFGLLGRAGYPESFRGSYPG